MPLKYTTKRGGWLWNNTKTKPKSSSKGTRKKKLYRLKKRGKSRRNK